MKIEVLKPNIVRIAIHQEQSDPHYGSCLWGYYDFDLDCIYECIVTDFTAHQKRIVEIFRDYVQPKIREIIKEEASYGQKSEVPGRSRDDEKSAGRIHRLRLL